MMMLKDPERDELGRGLMKKHNLKNSSVCVHYYINMNIYIYIYM